MFIGDILVALELASPEDVHEGVALQASRGWSLGECLVRLNKISPHQLEGVIASAPVSPLKMSDTGVPVSNLLNLMIKIVYSAAVETPSELAELMKLPLRLVLELVEHAEERQLMTIVGAAVRADIASERRYALTTSGADWARSAMRRSEYIGPAPVSLKSYCAQINRQQLVHDSVNQATIDGALTDMVVPEELPHKLGPAINSSRSLLLYGPPGNGKTSLAERVGSLFGGIVYIPYCFEVEGQIVKVFDPGLHEPIESQPTPGADTLTMNREQLDARWVACRRPFLTAGGELTLEMLDLGYNAEAKFYEAPLHIKALGGVFLIDDFGRQLVTPKALLNRWIVPLEGRRDTLKLISGKSFSIPFDELVIFATNLAPYDLMDAAFLRRIPYKVEVAAPTPKVFGEIFQKAAEAAGVPVTDKIIQSVITEISENNSFPLASYQPRFIIEQICAAGRFENESPTFHPDHIAMALSNLHTRDTPGYGVRARPAGVRQPHAVAAGGRA